MSRRHFPTTTDALHWRSRISCSGRHKTLKIYRFVIITLLSLLHTHSHSKLSSCPADSIIMYSLSRIGNCTPAATTVGNYTGMECVNSTPGVLKAHTTLATKTVDNFYSQRNTLPLTIGTKPQTFCSNTAARASPTAWSTINIVAGHRKCSNWSSSCIIINPMTLRQLNPVTG